MRRAPIVITATVLGTAGVLLFRPLSPGTVASATADDSGSSSSSSGSSGQASSGSSPSASGFSSSSPSSGSTTAKDGTYTGTAETTRFGTTQVEVTISGGRITEVTTVQLNQADPRSLQISEEAAPTLRSEVLAKQTAAVDTVSGATYTTAAYEASLQSALDTAGYTAPDGSTASTDVSSIQESGGFGH
ncbi:FMN-binding protein [Amnibacterium setariae]|uniref:FMN-binding protein n=1 Tax=Amnibacterium setariae TaxID=2306585 RepID=A0A3A1UD71_9MICO|nr:FMN-binding protein [Amnibacterium setariae]